MRLVLVAFFISINISSFAQARSNFNIRGIVKEGYAYKILLRYSVDDTTALGIDIEDTSIVQSGHFSFTGYINEPVQAYLVLDGNSSYAPIYLDTGRISVEVTINKIEDFVHSTNKIEVTSVKGSRSDSLQKEFYKHAKEIMQTDESDTIKSNNLFQAILKFVRQYPNHNLSSEFLKYAYPLSYNQAKSIYSNLSTQQQSKASRNGVSDFLARTQKLHSNYIFMAQPDTLGDLFSGKDLKYKYMLVQFWASWAAQENSNLLDLYKKYNKKGFEILGVSIDEEKTEWIKAIKEQRLMWHQISDLKGRNNALFKYYLIPYVPFSFLIDHTGKVISVGLRGTALKRKIEYLFP